MTEAVLGHVSLTIVSPAMRLLPNGMDSYAARALLLAIGLQESRFIHRAQINGPARGFWQFEKAGVAGVMQHGASRKHAESACSTVRVPFWRDEIWASLEFNDVLAAAFARLLLWTSPRPLPTEGEGEYAWDYYISCWRPGKPHRTTWDDFYKLAWRSVG